MQYSNIFSHKNKLVLDKDCMIYGHKSRMIRNYLSFSNVFKDNSGFKHLNCFNVGRL